ncbi:site-specific integrase [Novosphingobium sp. SG707]|uniref:site-specific integrase n=1 Tax=Novosphingobium sp. SG707 TaxID=2586996 RepID=UPI001445E20B|nr:site-specific integrase [Novosphingobium sp. SG707]NKJ03032.1 site-specific recombinase XerD [Novosphingobium sp. SG707]
MSDNRNELIAALSSSLISQRYSPVAARNYCTYASRFLDYLAQRGIPIANVTDELVEHYLRHAIMLFEKQRGRPPSVRWHEVPRSGIHALLRLVHGQWPPSIKPTCAADEIRFSICAEYESWLREERGLAHASIAALMWEARSFLAWQIDHGNDDLAGLNVADIDHYMDFRAPKLTRCSMKSVAERLRALLRHLYITGRVMTDMSGHVLAPTLYAYEGVPSALNRSQIIAVLESAEQDTSSAGMRDYAILQFLAVYGLRSGEIRHLRIEDIDWRREAIHVRHHKTRASTLLPLLEPVGEAVLAYLRSGRPETDAREIFVRTRAPYRKLDKLYSMVRRRLREAGVQPRGKCGPHIFRHARAVEMLRNAVPQKVIGDLLGHRSTGSTAPYLKLATEDLRAIAFDVSGMELVA